MIKGVSCAIVSVYTDVDQSATIMLKEFKTFLMRGNVLDLAIGIIIGGAFGKIVASLVGDILNPIIGLALGKVDFSNLFVPLNGQSYATIAGTRRRRALPRLITACSSIQSSNS